MMSALLLPGRVIDGDFLIEGPLSAGGMGAVFVALQQSTGIRRALKVMQPDIVQDAKARARFTREARVGASIQSDHVVHVICAGVDESEDLPFIVMELLSGENLAARIERQGPMDRGTLRIFFEQLCHALVAAHHVGIVHRDLKPENIYLTAARSVGTAFTVKVLDFGIAKLVADAGASATQAIGTPLWMAPEQSHPGGAIGAATDVWAMGLLAFYCITGKPYWRSAQSRDGGIPMLLREMLLDALVPPEVRAREIGTSLPPGFADWFQRCVQREPSARFPDAEAAQYGLQAWLAAPPQSAIPAATTEPMLGPPALMVKMLHGPRVSRRWRLATLVGVIGVVAFGGGLLANRSRIGREVNDDKLSPGVDAQAIAAGRIVQKTQPDSHILSYPVDENSVATERGWLRSTYEAAGQSSLMLEERELLHLEWEYITLHHYFRQAGRELVLLSTIGEGLAYVSIKPELQFLVLETTGERRFLKAEAERVDIGGGALFSSYGSPEVVVVDGARIVLDLGFDTGKRKLAELKGDELRVYWEDAARAFLGDETCTMLHGAALQACSDSKSFDETCDERLGFTGYLREIYRINDPGYNEDRFYSYCRRACRTGKKPAYEEFARSVCAR
jgi:tRNA A-37 threonylcarbamoyl transferase component Bud32